MLEDCSASPNADWGGNTVYSSREFLLLELFRALPLKVVWGRNSFREIGPNYVVRFEMSVSWLLLMCDLLVPSNDPYRKMTHWGKKNPVKLVFLLCVILDEGRKMAWPPSGTRMCSVSIAVFQQYFISVSEQTQNPTSVSCFPSPSQPCRIRHQIKQPMSYILMGWAVGIYTRSASTENAGV